MARGWRGKQFQQNGLTDDFPTAMPMGSRQRQVARVGSPGGGAGGLGTAGLGKSCLGAVLGAVRLLEQEQGIQA